MYNNSMISRPIHRARFTKAGYEKLKKEYEELKAERPAVVEDVKKAREMGDLKENGYYQASKAKLRSIDSRLMRVSYDLKTAKIIETSDSDTVTIGSTVTLANTEREMTYQFVGDLEADPSEKKLSLLSPIGKAVEGKKVGDTVEITTPSGIISYMIKKVV
jgi:transcription elongation factor GreA